MEPCNEGRDNSPFKRIVKQHLFSHGAYLGSREIPTYTKSSDGQLRINNSYVLFCPACGEVWGRLMHEHWGAFCQIIYRQCREHAKFPSDGFLSLRGYEDKPPCLPGMEIEDNWPVEAIRHEFQSALALSERTFP